MSLTAANAPFPTMILSEDSTPQIEVPTSVTFNLTTPGVTTEAQTITIRNTGSDVLEIATISLRSDHFLLDVPAGLTEIAPGASADLTVTFRPLRAFSVLGSSLRIRSNSGGELGNTFVSLRGNNPLRQVNEDAGDEPEDTTPAPRLLISGSTSFTLDTPGVSTQTVLLTIRNTGDAAFSFGTIQTSTPDFQVAVPAGLTQLAPGASVAIPVTYQPTTPFSFHSSNLTVSSSTSNAAVLSVRLRGNNPLRQVNDGTVVNNDDDVEEEEEDNGVPEIEAPETVSFSLNTEGVSTQTQTITISNVGGGVLEFSNIRIFSSNFVLNNAPEALTELAPGASLELSVTYRPRFSSSRHFGNLLISSNAGGSFTSTRVRLRGQNPFRQSNPRKSALSSSFGSITDTAPGVKNGSAATDALSASVFPNPVISVANLRIDAPATVRSVTVEVTNMVGKTVRQLQVNTHGSTTVPVDVADLTAGLYLLRVVDNEGEEAHTIKLLKQ